MENSCKEFVSSDIGSQQMVFRDIRNEPFGISGFFSPHTFLRLPETILPQINYGTAGGMVRFRTNSKVIAIQAELTSTAERDVVPHMSRISSCGFDLYLGKGTEKRFFGPPNQVATAVAGSTEIKAVMAERFDDDIKECTINFPLCTPVKNVFIGLCPGSTLEKPSPFTITEPLVFYGSSITQGCCASRPGNAYTNIIARWFDAEHLNLGFSGSAKGEPVMAEFIASLNMSVFVMDYDHNTTTVEYLINTHEPFYQIIRKARPDLPIILVSRPPDVERIREFSKLTKAVIQRTYENARASGDKRVFFVDGATLFGTEDCDACTVDGTHPNDLGFMRMAENIYPVVKKAIALYNQ
ncbi:MAG: SGNH/GDSL hydrolase family protein [Sedimentisphaerales bacterium]